MSNLSVKIKRLIPEYLKKHIRSYRIKKKYPLSRVDFNSIVCQTSKIERYVVVFPNAQINLNSSVGAFSYIQSGTIIYNTNVGKFCSIAKNVTIGLPGHPIDFISTNPVFYDYEEGLLPKFLTKNSINKNDVLPKTSIESDVWIGQGAMIKSGITIGTGAIVGAGAIVVKDVLPYSVVGGIPAKHIKYRFEEKIREELISSEWWKLSDDSLEKLNDSFEFPEVFIENMKKLRKKD